MRAAKALMVDRNFEGEFTTLLDITCELAQAGQLQCDRDVFHHALREILIAFPVYRTYGTAEGLSSTDKQLVSQVIARIRAMSSSPEQRAMDFIVQILCGDLTADQQPLATQFRIRFQQLTGPLMAKIC
jgi:maltooligosyl trehalose synthase (EC 5.4.99.15)